MALSIYDTLAAYNAEGEAVPYLAESIEPNEDATVWTVKLRAGIKFHDGTPLNAEAVKDTFDKHVEAGRVLQEGFTIEVVDQLTATFTFLEPFGAFPDNMASQWSWIESPTAVEEMGDDYRTTRSAPARTCSRSGCATTTSRWSATRTTGATTSPSSTRSSSARSSTTPSARPPSRPATST